MKQLGSRNEVISAIRASRRVRIVMDQVAAKSVTAAMPRYQCGSGGIDQVTSSVLPHSRQFCRTAGVSPASDPGLRLHATDGPFAVGSSPLVTGPTLALMMAMAGRAAYCDELDGDGVEIIGAVCGR